MSQSELAQRAGLSKATISNLESGRLRRIELETIAKLCRALSCNPNDLFEFPEQSEMMLLRRQQKALAEVLGTLKYDKGINPDELDLNLSTHTATNLPSSPKRSKQKRSA